MKLFLVVGTRPQIIKSVPIVYEANKRGLQIEIIHTGQHYDDLMSDIFFENFSLPKPIANLNVGSGSQGYQTGEIIIRLEKVLMENKPDLVIVPGDTNSALASSVIAAKSRIPLAHIESGARCYDMAMEEEINRRVIDHISSLLFTVSKNCKDNLLKENVLGHIIFSGDTMFEVYEKSFPKILENDILDRLKLKPKEYFVLTIHREENVEDPVKLLSVLKAITLLGEKVVFPAHPRTRNKLTQIGVKTNYENLIFINPLDYFSMMKLVKESMLVITDSGGLQKEAFWSKVPCITLRKRTEWVETVELGVNFLADVEKNKIINLIRSIINNYDEIIARLRTVYNPYVNAGLIPSKVIVDRIISVY
jgi:UDP-N-acetylglucosamine 2-epimerase